VIRAGENYAERGAASEDNVKRQLKSKRLTICRSCRERSPLSHDKPHDLHVTENR
jgi:hypothetical protein